MTRQTWTHDSGETEDGICAVCDDDYGMDPDMSRCSEASPDFETTDLMGDLPEGSAYCYCGHVIVR